MGLGNSTRFGVDTSNLKIETISQKKACHRWRTEAMRSHDTPRLLYFSKGQGRITVAGLTSGYGPNNLVYIPANTQYGYEAGPMVFGYAMTIPQAMAADWPKEPLHLRLRDVGSQAEFVNYIDALEREVKSASVGHKRAALHWLGLLSVFFERQIEAAKHSDERRKSAAARLVAAYSDLIERDYTKGKGVAEFAQDLGVTPTHLTRCCKQTCGKSALALLQDRVLYEARLRLVDTREPVNKIALELGFSSAAYFTRSFQGETGMTPTAFRKEAV
jgi:AraC-like DNA-binding protein